MFKRAYACGLAVSKVHSSRCQLWLLAADAEPVAGRGSLTMSFRNPRASNSRLVPPDHRAAARYPARLHRRPCAGAQRPSRDRPSCASRLPPSGIRSAAPVFLFAMHAVVRASASIPAIAFALPSSDADAPAFVDGCPLQQKGTRPGEALGASLSASALGGVLGAFALPCLHPHRAPVRRSRWESQGVPASCDRRADDRGLPVGQEASWPAACRSVFGFLAASVGLDVMTSSSRFTLGQHKLITSLNLAAVLSRC